MQSLVNLQIQTVLKLVNKNYRKGCDAKWLANIVESCQMIDYSKTEHEAIDAFDIDENKDSSNNSMIEMFELFLKKSQFNSWHLQALTSVMHRLQRYEKWIGFRTGNPEYRLILQKFDKDHVEDFADYMKHEYEYRDSNRSFFEQFHIKNEKHIRPVSKNSISSGVKRLFMFLNWAVREGYLEDTSFRNVTLDQCIYGTPYYLTLEERDKIMKLNLEDYPRQEYHRLKFMFQCLIGCRGNDLELFTWDHINGEYLEYIPHKNLLAGRTTLVRIPLCSAAISILEQLDPDDDHFFHRYCAELYRKDIKFILKAAGVDRVVTLIDPLTRQPIHAPIYEVAASHLARRTFIGNLYKKVKDPALIATLTGHTENSKSFARYRSIDDDIKRDILGLIE